MFTKMLECDIKLNIFGKNLNPKKKIIDHPLLDLNDKDQYISFDEIT